MVEHAEPRFKTGHLQLKGSKVSRKFSWKPGESILVWKGGIGLDRHTTAYNKCHVYLLTNSISIVVIQSTHEPRNISPIHTHTPVHSSPIHTHTPFFKVKNERNLKSDFLCFPAPCNHLESNGLVRLSCHQEVLPAPVWGFNPLFICWHETMPGHNALGNLWIVNLQRGRWEGEGVLLFMTLFCYLYPTFPPQWEPKWLISLTPLHFIFTTTTLGGRLAWEAVTYPRGVSMVEWIF